MTVQEQVKVYAEKHGLKAEEVNLFDMYYYFLLLDI